MVKYDVNLLSHDTFVEVAQSVAEQIVKMLNCGSGFRITFDQNSSIVQTIEKETRVKLRTRAEVDADIAEAVRSHNKRHGFPTDIPERDPKILFTYTDDSFPFIIDKFLREETEG